MRRGGAGAARRSGFRGIGSSKELAYGIKGFTDSTNFYQNGSSGAALASTPLALGCMVRIDGAVTGAQDTFCGRWNAIDGSRLYYTSAGLIFAVADGVGTEQLSTKYTTYQTGKTYVMGGDYDGTTLRFFTRSGRLTPNVTISGYTQHATDPEVIGCRKGGTTSLANGTFCGMVTGTSTLTEAQWATWIAACEAANDVLDFPTGTEYRWSVRDQMKDLVADSSWALSTGSGLTQTLNGSLTVEAFVPDYDG